jgi:predicted site-specific integrase-resolvase
MTEAAARAGVNDGVINKWVLTGALHWIHRGGKSYIDETELNEVVARRRRRFPAPPAG